MFADDAVRLLRRRGRRARRLEDGFPEWQRADLPVETRGGDGVNVLVILQGPAYGDERAFNGLRAWRHPRQARWRRRCGSSASVTPSGCAVAGQKLPDGYYHLDRMLSSAARHGAEIGLCGTCMDARGITDTMIVPTPVARLDEVTDWTLWADRTDHRSDRPARPPPRRHADFAAAFRADGAGPRATASPARCHSG